MMKRLLIIFIFLLKSGMDCYAQEIKNEEQIFMYAKKLEEDRKWTDALTIFKNLLKADSSNAEYLWRTSFLYTVLGFQQSTEQVKQQYYKTAAYLGKKAVTQHPQHANSHFAYALAIARMNEYAGNKTKIQNARLIKSEAEAAIKLDPKLPGPYHILGRWHRVIAGFNSFERTMIKAMFGGIPLGTYEESLSYFEKAISLEPHNGSHYIEAANTLIERNKPGDKAQAKLFLQKVMTFPVAYEQDSINRKKCESMLKKLK